MKQLKLLLILMILFIIPSVNAYTPVVKPQYYEVYQINISDYNSLNNQLIINIPYQVFDKVDNINGYVQLINKVDTLNLFKIKLKNTTTPTNDIQFRFYKYDNIGTYILIDSYNYSGNVLCHDWCEINEIINEISIENNKSYAIGIYSSDTNNAWHIMAYNQNSYFFDLPSLTTFLSYYAIITDKDGNNIYNNYYGNTIQIKHIPFTLYGQFKFPQNPINPEPPQTGNDISLPCTDCENWDNNNNLNGSNEGWIPDFNGTSLFNCPTCLGNETFNQSGTINKGSGFCLMIINFGYGSNNGCNSDDFIDFFYDYSEYFFVISILILIYKISILYKR